MADESPGNNVSTLDVWSLERVNWCPTKATGLVLACPEHTQAMYLLTLGKEPVCAACGKALVVTMIVLATDPEGNRPISQQDWEELADRLVNSVQSTLAQDGLPTRRAPTQGAVNGS